MEGLQDTILGDVYREGSRKTAELYSNALADYFVKNSGGNLTKEDALKEIENIVSEYQNNTSTNSQN